MSRLKERGIMLLLSSKDNWRWRFKRKVNDCSAAVKVDEDEESALMRGVENAMQVPEHAKLQYNSTPAALATHLLQ